MDARWGWPLAVLAVALGWWQWGGLGALMGVTVVVFWLLLQFSRALRVMKNAAAAPKGRVASAVMLHSRLNPGMTLMQILPLTGSLGELLPADGQGVAASGAATASGAAEGEGAAGKPPGDTTAAATPGATVERFRWTDDSGAAVSVCLVGGKLRDWVLERPAEAAPDNPP